MSLVRVAYIAIPVIKNIFRVYIDIYIYKLLNKLLTAVKCAVGKEMISFSVRAGINFIRRWNDIAAASLCDTIFIYRRINYSHHVDLGLACIPARCSCSCNASAVARFETNDIARTLPLRPTIQEARSIRMPFTISSTVRNLFNYKFHFVFLMLFAGNSLMSSIFGKNET